MSFQSIKKQWSEISLEKKLAMFVAPVFVAVASGILIPVMSGAFGGDGGSQPPASTNGETGGLEVVDLEVSGGEAPQGDRDPADTQLIDVTVRNTGQDISVIKGANLRIRDFAWIKICEGGAGLTPSFEYDVVLPADPDVGEIVETDISQQVPPNTADRFTIRLNVPEENWEDGAFLYQLDVELSRDTASRPLEAGTVIVSVPRNPDNRLLDAGQLPDDAYPPDLLACYETNEESFRRFLELEGERSPELNEQVLE